MLIQDNLSIKEIQEAFHGLYPGLKIEMYEIAHEESKGSKKSDQYDSSVRLSEIRSFHKEGDFTILPEMTVQQVEDIFEELYGLHVQIFRKSNTIWLQTSKTDHWTISESNRKGLSSMSKPKMASVLSIDFNPQIFRRFFSR